MSIKTCIFILTAWYLFSGCQKEAFDDTNYIDGDLSPFFDSFFEEAAQRGISLQERDLVSGYIEEIDGDTISGQCRYNEGTPNLIVINLTFWKTASFISKEFLVFHELGHCLLGRSHLDTKDRKGVCSSIMHSRSGICQNDYSYHTRSDYLDELFAN